MRGDFPLFWWKGISGCFSGRGFPAVLVGGDFPLLCGREFAAALVRRDFLPSWWEGISRCFGGRGFPTAWWEGICRCFGGSGFLTVLVGGKATQTLSIRQMSVSCVYTGTGNTKECIHYPAIQNVHICK